MSDPATGFQISVDSLTRLTQLVAAHGVYALAIITIFILQRRAIKNLQSASTDDDRRYFRQHFNWTTGLTFALILLASGVWFYGNFLFNPMCVVQGSIRGLQDQSLLPQSAEDPPYQVHRIANYRRDVDFYFKKDSEEGSEEFVLDWALVASARKEVLLKFQQQVKVWRPPDPFDLAGAGGPTRSKLASSTIAGIVKLDIADPRELEGQKIHLQYFPDSEDPLGRRGSLKLVVGSGFRELPWLDDLPATVPPSVATPRVSSLGFAAPAWASPAAQEDRDTARPAAPERAKLWRLLGLLGSGDLSDQILGRQLLVKQGAGAYELSERLLDEEEAGGYDRELLVHNLAAVMVELGESPGQPPSNLSKRLADELWYLRDPRAAARLYAGLSDKDLTSEWDLYKKGVSMFEAGDYSAAIPALERFLEESDSALGAEAPARYTLGCAYLKADRPADAKAELERVLALDLGAQQQVASRVALAGALANQGEQERADRIFDELVALDPRSAEHLQHLAELYSEVGAEPGNAERLGVEAENLRRRKPNP